MANRSICTCRSYSPRAAWTGCVLFRVVSTVRDRVQPSLSQSLISTRPDKHDNVRTTPAITASAPPLLIRPSLTRNNNVQSQMGFRQTTSRCDFEHQQATLSCAQHRDRHCLFQSFAPVGVSQDGFGVLVQYEWVLSTHERRIGNVEVPMPDDLCVCVCVCV